MIMRDESAFTLYNRLLSCHTPKLGMCMGRCVGFGEGGDVVSVKHTDPGRIVCDIMIDATAKVVRVALMGL